MKSVGDGGKINKTIDVLTFGDPCVDLILSGKDVVPEFGQKEKMVEDYSLEMGGSCCIFAAQTGRLGLRTVVIGKIGRDQFGELVVNTLNASGVSTDHIKVDGGQKTAITVAMDIIEDRAMLTYNGTIDSFEMSDISDELLKSVRHLHIGSYFLMKKLQPHYPAILKKLKAYGATVSLDTNWDPEEIWDSGIGNVLPYVDIFFPNENEAMAITGESSVELAIERLKNQVPILALKRGKDGAVVYSEGRQFEVPAVDVKKVDAIGAGDSFDGGFIYGYLAGKSMEDCGRLGCICGSLNTRAQGGTKGQGKLDEVLKYL